MKTIVTAALAALVVSLSAPAAAACKGKAATETTASSTDKAAPAQKSATVTPTTTAPPTTTAATTVARTTKTEPFAIVAVDEVSKALDEAKKSKKPYAVYDANTVETRQNNGVIPTAVLLSSSSDYDLALLPKDKATPVVFYCANEKCTASHTAAKRAATAGHTTVQVLGPGIKGWVAAGKAVDKPAA
ncbi:MAG TPA: rhodanese-like domain-containing protein [Myxococcota bacterium]